MQSHAGLSLPETGATTSTSLMRRRLAFWTFLGLLAAAVPGVWMALVWAEGNALAHQEQAGRHQLSLTGSNLLSELERPQAAPLILASDPEIQALLQQPDNERLLSRINQRLEELNQALGTTDLYIIDRRGVTLVASNWKTASSFIGHNFGFRPYFRAAIEGRIGRTYALGTASNVPGYYVAAPVRSGGDILGVAVVKVNLERLEKAWSRSGGRVIVTDSYGVVVMTSVPEWRFRVLGRLEPATADQLEDSLQYGIGPFLPLQADQPGEAGGATDPDLRMLRIFEGGTDRKGGRVSKFQRISLPVSDSGMDWTLHILLPEQNQGWEVWATGLIAALGAMVVALLAAWAAHRRQVMGERLAFQQQAKAELEAKVRIRTAELENANQRLHVEILERERTQETLKEAQNELVQAAKLAALGQMAAGIVHELNQPLAAIRAYTDNARIFLDQGRVESAQANLGEISALVERMAQISSQLKSFARKSIGRLEPVCLQTAVNEALHLLEARIRAGAVTVLRDWPGEPSWVAADGVRLQQVLVNVFCNALDAIQNGPERRLEITMIAGREDWILNVHDTGPGILPERLPQIFSPFFTTKEEGQGLGLGLTISAAIMEEFGGSLDADNHPNGGAVFQIRLPRAPAPAEPVAGIIMHASV